MKKEALLADKTIQALKWSALAEAAAKTIAPLTFLLLARLLSPEDFGVAAAAMVVISFSQLFSEAGLAKALIQRQSKVEESADIAFGLNMAIALLMAAVLIVASRALATFFHDARIAPVICVLSLQLPLAALSSIHVALMQKDLHFKPLFWVRLLSTTAPVIASIPLAIYGFGYWALVMGSLCGQLMQGIALWRISAWHPKPRFDLALAFELLAFGKWAMLSGVLAWFYAWMDAFVVGRYLGMHEMGLYRTGNTLATMIFGLLFAPVLPVLYSRFSSTQKSIPELSAGLLYVAQIFALIALPIGFFLLAAGSEIGSVVLGAQWEGIGSVIGILGLMHGLSWIVGANGEVYRAIGKPHVETWTTLFMLGVYLLGYLVSVHAGLQVFLETRLLLAALAFFVHVYVARRVLNIPPHRWMFGRALIVPFVSFIIVTQLRLDWDSAALKLIASALLFSALWLVGTYLLSRDIFFDLSRKMGFSKQ